MFITQALCKKIVSSLSLDVCVVFTYQKKKKSKFLNPQVSIYPYIGKDIYDVPIFVPMFCSCKNYNNQALVPKNLRASN